MSNDYDATLRLLADIQQDPASASSRLASLTRNQLIHLFGAFVEVDSSSTTLSSSSLSDLRSSAYLALSSFVSAVRTPNDPASQDDTATQTLVSCFAPAVEEALAGTDLQQTLSTFAFLTAFFQVDPHAALAIFSRDGLLDSLLDTLDLFASAGGPGGSDLDIARALATLFSHVAGQKGGRAILGREGDSRCIRWLQDQLSAKDARLKAVAGLALTKLGRGRILDGQEGVESLGDGGGLDTSKEDEKKLVRLLEGLVIDAPKPSTMLPDSATGDAIEALAYLSVEPSTKEELANNKALLTKFFAVGLASSPATNKKSATSQDETTDSRLSIGIHYGLALIIANLCAFRPRLSAEEEQVARLKRMAKAPLSADSSAAASRLRDIPEDPLDNDSAVKARIKLLIRAGVLPVLAGLARSDSATARACVASAYLAIVEEKANRGLVLQNGGSKGLMHIIQAAHTNGRKTRPDYNAIQALSKLAITASPVQVFGPDPGATHDAIGPLCGVLTASSNSVSPLASSDPNLPSALQRFEALMALTNIASMGALFAARIAAIPRLFASLDSLLLDDNTLTRRAAMELICNLIVSDDGFRRFVPTSPTPPPSSPTPQSPSASPKRKRPVRAGTGYSSSESRLNILVALSDVEDQPTRTAASGALAMLTSDEDICGVLVELERKRGRVIQVLGRLLIDSEEDGGDETEDSTSTATDERETERETAVTVPSPVIASVPQRAESVADPALVHRGIVCLRNLVVLFAAKRKPGTDALLEALAREEIVEKVEMVVKLEMEKGGERDRPSPIVESALELVLGLKHSVPE